MGYSVFKDPYYLLRGIRYLILAVMIVFVILAIVNQSITYGLIICGEVFAISGLFLYNNRELKIIFRWLILVFLLLLIHISSPNFEMWYVVVTLYICLLGMILFEVKNQRKMIYAGLSYVAGYIGFMVLSPYFQPITVTNVAAYFVANTIFVTLAVICSWKIPIFALTTSKIREKIHPIRLVPSRPRGRGRAADMKRYMEEDARAGAAERQARHAANTWKNNYDAEQRAQEQARIQRQRARAQEEEQRRKDREDMLTVLKEYKDYEDQKRLEEYRRRHNHRRY